MIIPNTGDEQTSVDNKQFPLQDFLLTIP